MFLYTKKNGGSKMKKTLLGLIVMLALMPIFTITASAAETETSDLPYIIEEGAVYYESAFGFGSGRHGTVGNDNIYANTPCYARITGYAFLDENGYIIDSDYDEDAISISIPLIENFNRLFLHFATEKYTNGWVDSVHVFSANETQPSENIVPTTEEPSKTEQDAEEIVEAIATDIQSNTYSKSTIVIDFSGSMDDNQKEVIELLETIDFNETTSIIAFATEYAVISNQQLVNHDFYVGVTTVMFPALNEAISLGTDNLVIISDLSISDLYYDETSLSKSNKLKNVVIYDPDDGSEDSVVDDVFKVVWPNAEINRIRIK